VVTNEHEETTTIVVAKLLPPLPSPFILQQNLDNLDSNKTNIITKA
jgi:hypothetical protein